MGDQACDEGKRAVSPVVDVLLATYNGEQYLKAQIDSLFLQDTGGIHILAHDDGSTDGTGALLRHYEKAWPERFTVLDGPPTGGPERNFELLMTASTAPYVMLADQDDVWDKDKVRVTLEAMRQMEHSHGPGAPLMVFTDMAVVDANLLPRSSSFWREQRMEPSDIHRLRSLLRRNVVAGCTAMLNRPLLEKVLPLPKEAFMHDWWMALVVSALGKATYLDRSTLRYRQHGGNLVGSAMVSSILLPNLRNPRQRERDWAHSCAMATALLRVHGSSLTPEQRSIAKGLLRSNSHPNRLVRVATFLRFRLFQRGWRANLGVLWLLWSRRGHHR